MWNRKAKLGKAMARRPPAPPPDAPRLSADQLRARISRLQRCIGELEAFEPERVHARFKVTEVLVLEASIKDALIAAFGQGTARYNLFKGAADLDQGPVTMRTESSWITARTGYAPDYDTQDARDGRRYLSEGKTRSIELLKKAIQTLEDDLAETNDIPPSKVSAEIAPARRVFVVHGHDDGAREAVARFLEKMGFEPVILHERANQGRTVIEKVEAHSDVGFAVVLLTPDDQGCVKGGELLPRARQNVLLELGYFIGKLTRERVCTLKVGDLEIPSDWRGVIDEPFDSHGAWKQTLARELQAVGYEIDWNRVMK
jgi:predicted nucleotide-binding protein